MCSAGALAEGAANAGALAEGAANAAVLAGAELSRIPVTQCGDPTLRWSG